MPKPTAPKGKAAANAPSPEELAELKALRKAQRDASQRVEELKLRLFQISERHMDQAIALMRRWINQ